MLSDRDAEEIEHGRKQKVGGPVVLKWIDQLLQDRRERIQQLEYLRIRSTRRSDTSTAWSGKPGGRPQ